MSGLWCFNPLLIGEAAPPLLAILALALPLWFQSPSHRGGGAARQPIPDRGHCSCHGVSIPFSSGRRRRLCPRVPRLGEVVATCFNPLLIGEAAPPEYPARRGNLAQFVSIPFSSWRRRRRRRGMACHVCSFLCFNPLLIGEAAPPTRYSRLAPICPFARFNPLLIREAAPPQPCISHYFRLEIRFNPLLIGEAAPPMLRLRADLVKIQVSIPFSSGRRPPPSRPSKMRVKFTRSFKSPSHRGGGAAVCPYTLEQLVDHCFNPLLIGEAAPPWRWSIV